jgi:hypothetical protein
MPYELRKVHGGYKVGHKGMSKTYSKKPQSKAKAAAQMRAIYANTPKSHMKEEVLHEEKQVFLKHLLDASKKKKIAEANAKLYGGPLEKAAAATRAMTSPGLRIKPIPVAKPAGMLRPGAGAKYGGMAPKKYGGM